MIPELVKRRIFEGMTNIDNLPLEKKILVRKIIDNREKFFEMVFLGIEEVENEGDSYNRAAFISRIGRGVIGKAQLGIKGNGEYVNFRDKIIYVLLTDADDEGYKSKDEILRRNEL
ncbi:hypothetical protein HY450_03140 [Candidatus Pacearchaeota archaeon]|nr:hypothetical protein [Candidatus Pacearchaeota archaeon]